MDIHCTNFTPLMDSSWTNLFSQVKQFDAYPKTLEDFRIKTLAGASVTISSGMLMIVLFIFELKYYLTMEVHEELFVDMSHQSKMRISMNITFPHLSCNYVSLDALDVSGQQQINLQSSLLKQRLDVQGKKIEQQADELNVKKNVTVVVEKNITSNLANDTCLSCYGAESKNMQCCNTCDAVKEAYRRKGWAFPADGSVSQCKGELDSVVLLNEGCNIFGYLEANKVAGNFHISPGKSYEINHMHVHDMGGVSNQSAINVTHFIHNFSFGEHYPGQQYPLDGWKSVAYQPSMCFQYYVKIVPTVYLNLRGETLNTYQYSVTFHQKTTEGASKSSLLPGLFVTYEFSPLVIQYTEKSRSFLHFLTSVCAIVGGVFTVAGLIDSFIYKGGKALAEKISLGKAT